MKCKDMILEKLSQSEKPLAVHEFHIIGYSENNIATRLSEMARAGQVIGVFREGENFKEWALVSGQSEFFPLEPQKQPIYLREQTK
jgi:DNA-binding transcriptional regulator GbsR (MarR family)